MEPTLWMPEAGPRSDCAVLRIAGDIDIPEAELICSCGLVAVGDGRVRTLIIDVGGVVYMGAAGLGSLVTLRNAASAAGKKVCLVDVPARVRKLLCITGMDRAFPAE
jgi:anti-sigma B factor antagonist